LKEISVIFDHFFLACKFKEFILISAVEFDPAYLISSFLILEISVTTYFINL